MTRLVEWSDNVHENVGIDLGEKVILIGLDDEKARIFSDYQKGKIEELIKEGIEWLGEDAFLDYSEVESSIGFEVLDYIPGDTYQVVEIYESDEKDVYIINANEIERFELSNGDVYDETYELPDGRRIAVDETIGQWVMLG